MKYLNIIKYQLHQKTNILYIIIVTIALISVIGLGTYKNMYIYDFTEGVMNDYYYRVMTVYDTKLSENKLMDKVQSLNNVIDATNSSYYTTGGEIAEFKTDKLDGGTFLVATKNEALPDIVNGENFPDDDNYYMICPTLFYPTNDEKLPSLSKKDALNIDSFINREVTFYNKKIKVIGTFNNMSKGHYDTCFVNKKVVKEIIEKQFNNSQNENISRITITVNEVKNVDAVKQEINDIGLKYEEFATLDIPNIEQQIKIINAVTNFIFALEFVLIFLVLQKDIYENQKYYKLLSYLGYNNKSIKNIHATGSFIKLLFCTLISIILLGIFIIAFNIILYFKPFIFYQRVIKYDLTSLLTTITILTITFILNLLFNSKEIIPND